MVNPFQQEGVIARRIRTFEEIFEEIFPSWKEKGSFNMHKKLNSFNSIMISVLQQSVITLLLCRV